MKRCPEKKPYPSGKSAEALAYSQKFRKKFEEKYGFVPSSILKWNRHNTNIDLTKDKRSYAKMGVEYIKGTKHFEKLRQQGLVNTFKTGRMGARHGGLSQFPQNVGRFILLFYCPEKGTVYDPFSGHNSRMQLVYESGRNYIGIDISEEFMNFNKKIRDFLIQQNKNSLIKNDTNQFIRLYQQTSANVKEQVNTESADFTITSPPYWDLEFYGDEEEQLGKSKTYEDFITNISCCIKENYRVLKPGSFCAWFVNDFRKGGIFYPYHADLIKPFEQVGFELFNICVIDFGRCLGNVFAQIIEKTRIIPKQHEYCLIFRKPCKEK